MLGFSEEMNFKAELFGKVHTSSQDSLLKLLSDQKYAIDQAAIVAQTDERGIITYVNDRFCNISGYSRIELIGFSHNKIRSEVHDRDFFLDLWRTISSGDVWRGDVCNRKKTGEIYWVATTIVPFLDAHGKPYQYMAIRQDITDLKIAQQKIMDQQAQLVGSSKLSAIGEMVAAITHEINNPLAVILGRSEMLKEMLQKPVSEMLNKTESLLRMVETIEVTGRRIEKIIKSMRALSHQDDEEPLEKVSLNEIIESTLEVCAQRFLNHGVQLIVPHVADELWLECRSHNIMQVLVNLLNNAYDAVEASELDKSGNEKDVKKWVRLDIERDDTELRILVTDSGPGIPVNIRKRLFQPFFSTKRTQYGTGLGLSVSRNLMVKQGGNLEYDSKCQNTRFIVRMPLFGFMRNIT